MLPPQISLIGPDVAEAKALRLLSDAIKKLTRDSLQLHRLQQIGL